MNPLSLIPTTWLWPIAAAVGAVMFSALGVQTIRLDGSERDIAEVKAAWSADTARRTQDALAADEKARVKEAADAAKLREVEDAYTALQTTHADALAAQRTALADNGRLRNAIAAYAAGSGASSPDSAAAASDRAARLGGLLAAALQADAEHASAAESNGDGVRTLLDAWPHDDESITLPKMKLGG